MKQEVKKKLLESRSDPSQAPSNATMALAAAGKSLLYLDLPSLPKYPSNFDDLTSQLESWDQDFLFLPNENDNADQGEPAILDLLARRLQETRTERDLLAMEAVDLRDRNELLEFRVLELEEQQEQHQQHVCRPESRRSPRLEDSLHESGIFDGDAWSDSGSSGVLGSGGSCLSRETQTESTHPQLGAEIERLGRVRAQIENNSATSKELGFYKARLEQVESRLEVLLASPEEQLRLLARRLEREAQLSAEASWLQQQISRLEARVEYLEMENSELQELENDARFKCQQMEANARMNCQTAERIRLLEETIRSYEERNYELEENEIELRDRLEFMERLLPAVILWNIYSKTDKSTHSARPLCLQSSKLNNFDPEVTRRVQERIQAVEDKITEECECNPNPLKTPESILELNYVAKLKALAQTETEVRSRMEALEQKEHAYFETLNQYDAIFAAMEADFNQKLATSQASEEELLSRIQKLESESRCSCSSEQNSDTTKYDEEDDVDDLALHNNRLEESIRALRCRLHNLEQDKRKQAERMNSELEACRTRVHDVLENVEGPLKKQLERANCRVNQLSAEIEDGERQMRLTTDEYEEQMFQLKSRIGKLSRELQHTECNNGELREEVDTLEAAVAELKHELSRQTQEHAKERSVLLANQTELKAEIESLQEQSLSQNEPSMRLSDELAAAENDDFEDEPVGDLEESINNIEEEEASTENPANDEEDGPTSEDNSDPRKSKEIVQTATATNGLTDSMNDLMSKLNVALVHLTECDSCKNLVGPTLEAILGDLSVVALEIDHSAPPGLPPFPELYSGVIQRTFVA